ncbi:histidine kinase OS=Tsukamurella paurometabola (strain ATCC 8368 / DSM / CCUG 35730 / CIP 100753/ JCM 10117 / KCTC 9821 / NBRC 16120 / NCIMB 702349 / NCTC 13040) OX=521096 GN=Tpau_1623 PE=4 SV=1 [Tsukamurella paurometabola]|uniref:histidine kinase n=1 Tax=Tsukamurella paurometabola (strain ATCC 8368 / DSM 20162 / CCUG 35730 / CIP 100753 / JCM 10117 / KCTC 9821 / NBRC 16120 / NCIMB 702349 / NCTC 13040) TaxID=521096 RepID=D5UYD7_TSUPD|nr:integral membrane sensor signal transduction histidine kinase [Tsukamurella paurometabola DSM 20162]SUP30845.1 Sensor-type histidine kinase prrB [Tsukamurella paurometabola]
MRLRLAFLTGAVVFVGYAAVAWGLLWLFGDSVVARLDESVVPGDPFRDTGTVAVEQVFTRWARIGVVITAPLAGLITGVIAWYVAGRALRPVGAIEQRFRALASGDLSLRVPEPGGDDEVARLARTMNETLERMEAAGERQRRFVADAAHELRGPIGAVRTDLEVAARYPDRIDAAGALNEALVDVERLQTVATDLLTLARLESGDSPPATTFRISDVLDEIVTTGGTVTPVRGAVEATVRGSRPQLTRLVQNLVDNAARHARSTVSITVSADDTAVTIDIDDDGSGIPAAHRDRVFDRFYRLDEARSSEDGGSGLGLAIVAEIARAHGGTVVVEDSPLGGARFRVRLPAAK